MSRELVWELTRESSCFVVRRGTHEFSREAGNLRNKNTYKYSTLAANKVNDVPVLIAIAQLTEFHRVLL